MIDLDELEALHREGLRYPEGVEYDVARDEAFHALPALLRLARRARRLEDAAAALMRIDAQCWMVVDREVSDALDALRAALAEGEEG